MSIWSGDPSDLCTIPSPPIYPIANILKHGRYSCYSGVLVVEQLRKSLFPRPSRISFLQGSSRNIVSFENFPLREPFLLQGRFREISLSSGAKFGISRSHTLLSTDLSVNGVYNYRWTSAQIKRSERKLVFCLVGYGPNRILYWLPPSPPKPSTVPSNHSWCARSATLRRTAKLPRKEFFEILPWVSGLGSSELTLNAGQLLHWSRWQFVIVVDSSSVRIYLNFSEGVQTWAE